MEEPNCKAAPSLPTEAPKRWEMILAKMMIGAMFRIFYGEETVGEHNQDTGKRQESNQNRMCFPYSGNNLDTFRKISGNATDDAACEKSD